MVVCKRQFLETNFGITGGERNGSLQAGIY